MKSFSLVVVLALSAMASGRESVSFLKDAAGRDVVLHGLNVSNDAKSDPLGVGWHTEADYERMARWGFDAVRLLVFWSHIEPGEGVFDDAYLDRVETRLEWAAQQGLSVIIDAHMDLYGPKFGGDGAPEWATRDDGRPFVHLDPWWLNYVTPPVRAAYSHLWRDSDLQAHFFASWSRVARRFAGHPAVVGYEVLNEPFMGNEGLFAFETDYLVPFYRGAAAAIRAEDPDAVIFFEPSILISSGLLPSTMSPIGGEGRWVYAPHFYQTSVHEGWPYDGNDWLIRRALKGRTREAARHGTPWILGEFGVAETTENHDLYLRHILQKLDRLSSGWTYWSYDKGDVFAVLDADGRERTGILDRLIYPYPRAVAGAIRSFRWDPDRRLFTLLFTDRAGVSGPTEIHVPVSRVYPEGFQVKSSDCTGRWRYVFDPIREVLEVTSDPARRWHVIRIEPAP